MAPALNYRDYGMDEGALLPVAELADVGDGFVVLAGIP